MNHTEQRLKDEATVFTLAYLLIEQMEHVAAKNNQGIAQVYFRFQKLMRQDTTFIVRFKKAQEAMRQMVQQGALPPGVLIGVDQAIGPDTTVETTIEGVTGKIINMSKTPL